MKYERCGSVFPLKKMFKFIRVSTSKINNINSLLLIVWVQYANVNYFLINKFLNRFDMLFDCKMLATKSNLSISVMLLLLLIVVYLHNINILYWCTLTFDFSTRIEPWHLALEDYNVHYKVLNWFPYIIDMNRLYIWPRNVIRK